MSFIDYDLMAENQIKVIQVINKTGNEIPSETFYQKDKDLYHGAFRIAKLVDCRQDHPECETEDCECDVCPDRCLTCNPFRCTQCESPYGEDKANPKRCYIDSEPFSESFNFTISEDFTKSFNFTASNVFSPTRSEIVIIAESNTKTKFIIIGSSVGGVVVISVVVVLAFVFCRRKQLPFTSNEDSMIETVIPMQEDQLTVDDSSDSSMLSQHDIDPFLPANYPNQIQAE